MYIPFRSFHQRHTIKNFVWGELKRYVRYNTEEKNYKKLRRASFYVCVTVGSRNMSSPSYLDTSHIRKGINFSIQNSLFLMSVNHLLFRKRREGFCWKEKKLSAFRKGTRKLRIPKTQSAPETST